jgi:transcription elongation factor Elf1
MLFKEGLLMSEPKFFCPFCGSNELTTNEHYDYLLRRAVVNVYCNKCGKLSLIIEVPEESRQALEVRRQLEKIHEVMEKCISKLRLNRNE